MDFPGNLPGNSWDVPGIFLEIMGFDSEIPGKLPGYKRIPLEIPGFPGFLALSQDLTPFRAEKWT